VELRSLAKLLGIECVDYPSTQSFVKEGAFVQVWNEGTFAWKSIAEKYQEFNPMSLLRDKAIQFPSSHRGNRSLSVGFTGQSHCRDERTSVQKPVLRTKTLHWAQEMASLSQLLKVCGGAPPDSDYSRQRQADFAKLIHRDNMLEGFTPCITNILTEEVQCHLDCHNDQSADGFGVVIVASQIKNGERYAGVGYFKNPCGSYYHRLIFTNRAVLSASRFFDRLDLCRQRLSLAHFRAPQELSIHGFSRSSACMDKAAHYSPYVHVFRLLVHTHGLSLSRALESLLPVGWEWVTPESYFRVLSFWIESDKLPTQNLALAFLRRETPHGIGVTSTQIEQSLWNLRVVTEDLNSSPVLHRHKLHSTVSRLMELVAGTSKISCQRLASVAALAGILRHPALATQACHSPTEFSDLTTRIRDVYGCSTVNQASEVINAVASAMDISRGMSESIFSEMLLHPSDSSFDCYFPGQTFFTVEDNRVLQLFPDGTREYLQPIICSADDFSLSTPSITPPRAVSGSCCSTNRGLCATSKGVEKRPKTPARSVVKRKRIRGTSSPRLTRSATEVPSSEVAIKRDVKRKRISGTSSPRFTRSATEVPPSKVAILDSSAPWASVNLLSRALQVVGCGSFGKENIKYVKEVNHKEGRSVWRAICHCNGRTWDPQSSSLFGGLLHDCRHIVNGSMGHMTKKAALDHLLLYLCLYGDKSDFSWERKTLLHNHFVCLKKQHTITRDNVPFIVLFLWKGQICIGHYNDNWRSKSVLCSA
jgi:hypothetical protein